MTVTKINKLLLVNEGDESGAPLGGKYQTDIHLIRNGVPFDVFSLITMHVNADGDSKYLRPTVSNFPSNITITIKTNIKDTKTAAVGLEISSSSKTWNIKALEQPSPTNDNFTKLKAFIITVSVSLDGGPSLDVQIRVFVHAEFTSWWLTPASLTLRPVAISDRYSYTPKFTIYANFNGIIADITELNGILAQPNEILIGSTNRTVVDIDPLNGNTFVPNSDITFTPYPGTKFENAVKITLPPHLGGGFKNADISYTNWANEPSGKTQIWLSNGPGYT